MSHSVRQLLVGRNGSWYGRALWSSFAVVLGLMTFFAYVIDVFAISGGVVFVPGHAALTGIGAAAVVGYFRGGLVVAWLATFSSLLGYRAYHAFPGLSYRTFPEQLTYFLDPEGLFVFAVEGLALGVLPFLVGSIVRWGIEAVLVTADTSAAD